MYVHDGYKYFFAPVEHFIISEAKSAQSAIGSNDHPVSQRALTSPFDSLGNWAWEASDDLPKHTQPTDDRAGAWIQTSGS